MKRGPEHISCLYQDTYTLLFSFSKTVCCYVGVSMLKVKRKKNKKPFLFVCYFWLELYVKSFSNFTVRKNYLGHVKKHIPRAGSQWFVSGNGVDDHVYGSWTDWRALRVWAPFEKWNFAGCDVINFHFSNHGALSDLEFHISPLVFFILMLNPCWIFKRWLEKMQIYWALTCQRRRFLINLGGDPEFKFFFLFC